MHLGALFDGTSRVQGQQFAAQLETGRPISDAEEVADGWLSNTALSGYFGLRKTSGREFSDQLLPVHRETPSLSVSPYSAYRFADCQYRHTDKVEPPDRTSFGARLHKSRKARKLTQKAVSTLLGISQGTLSELETEAHSSGHTAALARIYGVDPYWLATGEGASQPTDDRMSAPAEVIELRDMSEEDREFLRQEAAIRSARFKRLRAEILGEASSKSDGEKSLPVSTPPSPTPSERLHAKLAAVKITKDWREEELPLGVTQIPPNPDTVHRVVSKASGLEQRVLGKKPPPNKDKKRK